ncbi:MAG TPA: hypothetical protein VFV25_10465 [Methylibium sp.]
MRQRLTHWLRRKPWALLLGLGLCLLGFGVVSLNLFFSLSANLTLIREHGWMALRDGAARQLFELLGQGVLATLFYAGLKVFERLIVEWWLAR